MFCAPRARRAPLRPLTSLAVGFTLAALAAASLSGCGPKKITTRKTEATEQTSRTAKSTGETAKETAETKATEFNTAAYDRLVENPFQLAARTPLSTFSVDVDTASYTNVRHFLLTENRLPPKDAVRVEELVNFFAYAYPQPQGEHPVSITTEVAACPWDARQKLVRIGLRARSFPPSQMPPRNLVFLLDTSGSMAPPNRLPLLRESLKLLVQQLRPQDRVAIVAYAGSVGLVLPSTSGRDKGEILGALSRLEAGGSTNGGEGIRLAYRVAEENFIKGGVNRVILGTDGDFNVGVTSRGELVRLVEEKRKGGVLLTVLGFGMDNLKDSTMQDLAHHGNGHYAYIDTLEEARRLFVEQGAALQVVAGDVKVQVEFNPANVQAYRLIGYESRLLRDQDFNDDTKDAGDMGSGHTVTALYAIVPPGVKLDLPGIDPLKYQQPSKLSKDAHGPDLLTVKVRYKHPGEEKSQLLTQPVEDRARKVEQASEDFRFAAAVAAFGMLLRDSPYRGSACYEEVLRLARGARGEDPNGHRAEFLRLVQAASRLSGPRP